MENLHKQLTIRANNKQEEAEDLYRLFMYAIGIPDSEHSDDTPARVAKFFTEFTKGYNQPDFNVTTFKDTSKMGQVVVVKGIEFYSLCAHHHLPFFGTADFAYVSSGNIVGLSKIPRIIQHVAKQPTTQEDLTNNIVKLFEESVNPLSCGVILRARHMCMSMRGVQNQGAETTTECIRTFNTEYNKKQIIEALRG